MTASSSDLSFALPTRCPAGGLLASGTSPPEAAGPGWFESSWDLRRGLEVSEGGTPDAGLRSWIEEFLGAQAPGSCGASFSAT